MWVSLNDPEVIIMDLFYLENQLKLIYWFVE